MDLAASLVVAGVLVVAVVPLAVAAVLLVEKASAAVAEAKVVAKPVIIVTMRATLRESARARAKEREKVRTFRKADSLEKELKDLAVMVEKAVARAWVEKDRTSMAIAWDVASMATE